MDAWREMVSPSAFSGWNFFAALLKMDELIYSRTFTLP
jgi:hypothetical protein